jgi:DNA topoisomerase-1
LEARLADGVCFRAQVPVHDAAQRAACERAATALAAGHGVVTAHDEIEEPLSRPWGYEDVVAQVADRLDLRIQQAADLFQEAYEKGKVSYPRVRSGAWTQDAVEVAASVARYNRCAFDPSKLHTRDDDDGAAAAHEAPRVYDGELMLGRPLNVLDPIDAVSVLIARNMIESGQVVRTRRLMVDVEGMSLTLRHESLEPRKNWKRPRPEVGYRAWPRELALLRYMQQKDLGRPSTVIRHVTRAVQHGLIEETGVALCLTERGNRWLTRAREVGITAHTAKEMERELARPMRDPYARAGEILASHGMLTAVQNVARSRARPIAPVHADVEPL